MLERVDTVARCIQKLDVLRPNPFSTPQYIDLIIDAEQQEKRLGFKERIESLKKLRQMAVITSKIRDKQSLLTTDRKDDVDGESTDEEDGDDEETASNGHYIQSKIKNKESLLSLDRKDDLLDDQADDDYNAIKTLKVTPRRPLQMI